MQRSQKLLENGTYGKLIISLCIPSIVIMIVMIIYNMADTFFIGQTGDPNKVAAISLCGPIFTILSGIGTLLGNGGCMAISIALGKGEKRSDQGEHKLLRTWLCWNGIAVCINCMDRNRSNLQITGCRCCNLGVDAKVYKSDCSLSGYLLFLS